jgi:hypothetical protein
MAALAQSALVHQQLANMPLISVAPCHCYALLLHPAAHLQLLPSMLQLSSFTDRI